MNTILQDFRTSLLAILLEAPPLFLLWGNQALDPDHQKTHKNTEENTQSRPCIQCLGSIMISKLLSGNYYHWRGFQRKVLEYTPQNLQGQCIAGGGTSFRQHQNKFFSES